jgi:RNase H-fold protein (predicted Holliday junction resolvase)
VTVLAIDPGRHKCGIAVRGPAGVVARGIVRTDEIAGVAQSWAAVHRVEQVIVGNRTGSDVVLPHLAGLGVPVVSVEEWGTTLAARRRYFEDHPPRGWRRLLPLSLLVPPEPYDDYAAIVLAEVYLTRLRERHPRRV